MKIFVDNQNGAERVVRLIIACLLIPAYFIIESNLYTLVLSIIGELHCIIQLVVIALSTEFLE